MTDTRTNWRGLDTLHMTREVQPLVVLTVYRHAVTVKKPGQTEYAVHPDALADAFQKDARINTGLLTPDTLFVEKTGDHRAVAAYRAPQRTALWLEGSEDAVVVPLPGLVMLRQSGQHRADYRVFAVKGRPASPDDQLYHAPLPNVGATGVCWGTVRRPNAEARRGNDLSADWTAFLGSRFGNHEVPGKSRRYRKDIREALLAYAGRDVWPDDDLVPLGKPFGELMR